MMEEEEQLKPLTRTDLATLAAYLKSWNATRAWMETHPRASYNSARASAAKWLRKSRIKNAVDEFVQEKQSTASDEFEKLIGGFITKARNKKSEHVYLIRSANGLTKIGVAKNVKSRFDSLNTASPVELNLYFYWPKENPHSVEKMLHKKFSEKRVKGEWFNLSESDIYWIKTNYDLF